MKDLFLASIVVGLVAMPIASYSQPTDTAVSAASKKATSPDRQLAKSVRRALAKAQGFDVSGVFVKARDGTVTLSGAVKSGEQIPRAEEIAKSVPGVTVVNNKLTLFHGGNN